MDDIAILELVYAELSSAGRVRSKAEFSEGYLGKAASYLTSTATRRRQVPMDVLDHLSLQLLERVDRTRSVIADLKAELIRAHELAAAEAETRNIFEEHYRRRLAGELGEAADTDVRERPTPETNHFIRTVLRKAGLAKDVEPKPATVRDSAGDYSSSTAARIISSRTSM